jgi:hypothetical protein
MFTRSRELESARELRQATGGFAMIRTRWAAIGAAVAVTLGGGGFGLVGAVGTTPSVYVPITPCRVLDTRANHQVGGRSTPLAEQETYRVEVGDQDPRPEIAAGMGGCPALPVGITAVALNVTAVNATANTHLTLWDSGPVPNTSSLNPSPGQPPVPNAVTTKLASDLSFQVFNYAGKVDVIIDVVGYFDAHSAHQTTAQFGPGEPHWPEINFPLPNDGAQAIVAGLRNDLRTTAPSTTLIVNAAITVLLLEGNDDVSCRLVLATTGRSPEWLGPWQSTSLRSDSPGISSTLNIALTAGVDVEPGVHDLYVSCARTPSETTNVFAGGAITAIAVPVGAGIP